MAVQRFFEGPNSNTIGKWVRKMQVGRPASYHEDPEDVYVMLCNYTFRVVAVVENIAKCEATPDAKSGWLLKVSMKGSDTMVYMRSSSSMSKTPIARCISENVPGIVSQVSGTDFLRFVNEDISSAMPVVYVTDECGYFKSHGVWVFSSCTVDQNLNPLVVAPLIFRARQNTIAHQIRPPDPDVTLAQSVEYLRQVCRLVISTYGDSAMHAMHIISNAWKAVFRSQIFDTHKQAAICNVSGPPNTGKSLACAVALSLIGCSSMHLSKATSSSMLQHTTRCRDLLIVWDDPRDSNRGQMESIVHEAFHCHASSTMAHGDRQYKSSLIIGTQNPNLGFNVDAATSSRLSHVHMSTVSLNPASEDKLKRMLPDGSRAFRAILSHTFKESAALDIDALGVADLLPRAVTTLSVDYAAMCALGTITGTFTGEEVRNYIRTVQLPILRKYCTSVPKWTRFLRDVQTLMKDESCCEGIKPAVNARLEGVRKKCVALYLPAVFRSLSDRFSVCYTEQDIQNAAKQMPESQVCRHKNVNFSNIVQRSMVVCHTLLEPPQIKEKTDSTAVPV